MASEASITSVNMRFAKESYERFLKGARKNERGCLIPNKIPREDGYVRYSITKGSAVQAFGPGAELKERTFYVHHLAWYVAQKPMPVPRIEHLSHLCSDPRCFNVDHLVVEIPKENNDRKGCGFIVTCPCPCGHVFNACQHEPKCIPRTRGEKRKAAA